MNKQVKEYRENPALNQSKLKKLLGYRPWEFLKDDKEETESLKLGSLVDCLFLTPEEFHNEFYVSMAKKPSDMMRAWVDEYYDFIMKNDGEPSDFYYENVATNIAKERKYYLNCKTEAALLNKLYTDGLTYLQKKKQSQGLTVVTQEQYEQAQKIVSELSSYVNEHHLFFENKIKYVQAPLYGNYYGVNIKGLLDMLLVDMENHKFQIIDLKTTSGATMEFPESLRKYRYDIQMAWYKELVRQNAKQLLQDNGMTNIEELAYCEPNFDIECYFLVASTIPEHTESILLQCDRDILDRGKYGYSIPTEHFVRGEYLKLSYKTEGFKQLMTKYINNVERGFANTTGIQQLYWNEIR